MSDLDERVTLLKTIADATRLRILGLLAERPRSGTELATELELTAPTISHHLPRAPWRFAVLAKAAGTTSRPS